jgi:hypothetical protein
MMNIDEIKLKKKCPTSNAMSRFFPLISKVNISRTAGWIFFFMKFDDYRILGAKI